jgi:Flp pilus assembly protein TadD
MQEPGASEESSQSPGPDLPARSPLVYLSFYIELPFDLGLRRGQATRKIHISQGPLADWADLDLDTLLGMPAFDEPGTFPCTTFYFRRAILDASEPLAAVTYAFPEVYSPDPDRSLLRRARALARDLYWLVRLRLRDEFRTEENDLQPKRSCTVVQAVRIVGHDTGIFGSAWLEEQFESVLSELNEYLLAIAAVSPDLRVGQVTRAEIQPIIPGFQADFRDGLPLRVQPLSLLSYPGVPEIGTDLPEEQVAHAMRIVGDPREARPFFPSLELMVAAQRSLFGARLRHAVLESGTATEILLYTALREIARGEDWPEEKLRKAARRFRNMVADHVAPALGFSPEPERSDDALGRWWQTGYQLRNRVAHEGHHPSREEAVAAIASAEELNLAVGVALSKHPATSAEFPHEALNQPPPIAELLRGADPPGRESLLRTDETLDPGVRAFNLGVVLLQQQRRDEAEAEFRRAVELSRHAGAALNLGGFCLSRDDVEQAETFYRLAADSLHPNYGARAALALGDLIADRDPDDAEHYYRRAIASDNEQVMPEACFALGSLLESAGREVEAERAWEQGMAHGDGRSAANLGNRRQARGDNLGAETALRRALDDETVRPLVAVNLALLLKENGRDEEAAEMLTLGRDLGNERAALYLGLMKLEAGDAVSAREEFERAKMGPEAEVVQSAGKMLARLDEG